MLNFKIRVSFFCLLFLSYVSYGQINVKDSLLSLLNIEANAEDRFAKSGTFITLNVSPEEAETLGKTILYPFVQENWESQPDQLSRFA